MAPSPTGGSGNAVRCVAVGYGEGRAFFLLIHRTSQSEVLSPFPYKGRLIGNAVCFVAIAYGEKYANATTLEPQI